MGLPTPPVPMTYQLTQNNRIIIQHMPNGDTRWIPMTEDNSDYQDYLAWSKIPGNKPDPADPPIPPDPTEEADKLVLSDLGNLYQGLLDNLNTIQATRAQLDSKATTLSTITVTSFAQVQNALRQLGDALAVMIDNTDKLSKGSEKTLKVLAALKRNLGR